MAALFPHSGALEMTCQVRWRTTLHGSCNGLVMRFGQILWGPVKTPCIGRWYHAAIDRTPLSTQGVPQQLGRAPILR
jgi:hypothetical protein